MKFRCAVGKGECICTKYVHFREGPAPGRGLNRGICDFSDFVIDTGAGQRSRRGCLVCFALHIFYLFVVGRCALCCAGWHRWDGDRATQALVPDEKFSGNTVWHEITTTLELNEEKNGTGNSLQLR